MCHILITSFGKSDEHHFQAVFKSLRILHHVLFSCLNKHRLPFWDSTLRGQNPARVPVGMKGIALPSWEDNIWVRLNDKEEAAVEDLGEHSRWSEGQWESLEPRTRLHLKRCGWGGAWRRMVKKGAGRRHRAESHRPWQGVWILIWLQRGSTGKL